MNKKVIITNRQGIETHSAIFATQEKARAWVEFHLSVGAFGRCAGVYYEGDISLSETFGAVEIKNKDGAPCEPKKYSVPDQFVVQFEDTDALIFDRGLDEHT